MRRAGPRLPAEPARRLLGCLVSYRPLAARSPEARHGVPSGGFYSLEHKSTKLNN